MNHVTSETFRENARIALGDVQLRGALKNATSIFGAKRGEAAASVPDWEELRNHARAIKDESLLHLDRYLEEFVRNADTSEVDMFLRLKDGKFEVKRTLARGQWGATQDDAGRIFRNSNESRAPCRSGAHAVLLRATRR